MQLKAERASRTLTRSSIMSISVTHRPQTTTPPAYGQSAVTRALNSVFIASTSRNMLVSYSVELSATISLVTGQTGTTFLEISPDGTTGWTEIARLTNGNTGTLTIGLNLTQNVCTPLVGTVPAGYSARLRTTGGATATYRSGQETMI